MTTITSPSKQIENLKKELAQYQRFTAFAAVTLVGDEVMPYLKDSEYSETITLYFTLIWLIVCGFLAVVVGFQWISRLVDNIQRTQRKWLLNKAKQGKVKVRYFRLDDSELDRTMFSRNPYVPLYVVDRSEDPFLGTSERFALVEGISKGSELELQLPWELLKPEVNVFIVQEV